MKLLLSLTLLVPFLQGHPIEGDHLAPQATRPTLAVKGFPSDPNRYRAQTAALVNAGIPEKYGPDEWAAVVLTHEFHQHVGIYTVLGAKMAVRAREVLHAPTRSVQVLALTGRTQPLACTLDGLQVGLASTFGQNLIQAPEVEHPAVSAEFTYEGQHLRLSLKPMYQEKVTAYIRHARALHGNLTPGYFQEVEKACYEVWSDFDRRDIFAETLKPIPAAEADS